MTTSIQTREGLEQLIGVLSFCLTLSTAMRAKYADCPELANDICRTIEKEMERHESQILIEEIK